MCRQKLLLPRIWKIEAEMKKIVKGTSMGVFTMTRRRGHQIHAGKERTLRVQLLRDLPEDAKAELLSSGQFVDLCAGPTS